jgi:molybdopterin synthase catalytic subunit
MRVTVKLFAGLRERAGWGERELEAASVAEVWPQLGLGEEPAGLLYAVNQEYADRSAALSEGDEVAIIPPVSGGAFRLADRPLDLAAVVAEVEDERAGAIVTFQGTVRRQSRGRRVIALEYEAYAGMAEKVMGEIAGAAKERHDLGKVAIAHRTGRCEVGEVSVVIAVSAAHRHPALAACREIIDELKGRVPLWKKELYEGGEEWIGRGS